MVVEELWCRAVLWWIFVNYITSGETDGPRGVLPTIHLLPLDRFVLVHRMVEDGWGGGG